VSIDLDQQKQILQQRLVYYRDVVRDRPPEYNVFKAQKAIPNILRALEKIGHGNYGRCDDCDETISADRLKVIPAAIRCVECQKDHESLY
jgi:RNA polymerase-binding transcription factor DksA